MPGVRPDVKPEGQVYDVDKIFPPEPEERGKKKVLWTEHREFVAKMFEEACKDAFDYAHSLKNDAIMLPLFSLGPVLNSPFSASLASISALRDMIAIDPHWDGIPEEAFYCDLMRANTKGPTIITLGAGLPYIRGNAKTLKHDLAICFVHTDGMYVFDWIYVFKQRPYVTNNPVPYWSWWWEGAWEYVWATARKVRKLEKYLIKTNSPARVAMLYSERNASVYDYRRVPVSMGAYYCRQQMGLYCLFMEARIQEDPIFAEGLAREKLDRYDVLFVQNASALTPEQEQLIRSWVRDSGQLIATASTSILDRWGRKQKDYRLADVFGVRYMGTAPAGERASFGQDPVVHYASRRLRDIVEPTTGRVVSRWMDGIPAVVVNTFGNGACTFISTRDLGLCYEGRTRRGIADRIPVHKKFYPGVRDFVREVTLRALKARGKEPLFFVRNCPDEVETVMRVQNGRGSERRILPLELLSDRGDKWVATELPVREDEELKVFYPVDEKQLDFERRGNRVSFKVREFDVHEAIVTERKEE